MEEKERYGITDAHYFCDSAIFDTETDEILRLYQICDLLNQQAKKIHILNEQSQNNYEKYTQALKENQQLKQQLAESEVKIANLEVLLLENANDMKAMQEFKIGEDEYDLTDEDARNSLCWEVEELKQQLHDLPKKIVEEVEKDFTEYLPLKYKTGAGFYARLNVILKKYVDKNISI